MPQMLAIQPATPKAPSKAPGADSRGNKEQNQFSPHLKNAISHKKQQQEAQEKSQKENSPSTDKNTLTDKNSQSLESKKSDKGPESSGPTQAKDQDNGAKEDTDQTYFVASADTEKTAPISINSVSSDIQQIKSEANLLQNASAELGDQPSKSRKTSLPFTIVPDPTSAVAEPVVKTTIATGQDTLISQLQAIIDNANETGTVSITKTDNGAAANSIKSNIHGLEAASFSSNKGPDVVTTTSETSDLTLNGIVVADVDGVDKNAGKPMQQVHGIRNDSQQQPYNAKINTPNLAENSQNSQENKQGEPQSKQTLSSGLQSGPLSGVEQTNTFSQISSITQQTTAQPTNETTPPIVLPSGTIVHEEDVLRQLTERFQVSNKQMDSRINLKLHPAELGELKIDLTVKEGSIRANIVAQSNHTLDILQKNIPKLRTLLENQGFTIDQISVTAESDSVSDFDFFDRQQFGQNDYKPTAQKGHRDVGPAFIFGDNEFSAPAMQAGVNVKI